MLQLVYPFCNGCTFVIFYFGIIINKAAMTILVLHMSLVDIKIISLGFISQVMG